MFKYLIAILMSTTLSLPAWLQPEPGHFGLQGEILWLLPSVEDRAYFLPLDNLSDITYTNERFQKTFSYHPGYRLEGAYTFCNKLNDMRIRWTAFTTTTTDSHEAPANATGSIFAPVQFTTNGIFSGGAITECSSEQSLKYYSVDALLGQHLFSGHRYSLALQGGVQYYNLRSSELYVYGEPAQLLAFNTFYHDKVWGIGPEFAIDFQYLLPHFSHCLSGDTSFVINAKGALLATKNDTQMQSSVNLITTDLLDFENEPFWHCVPQMDLQFGLNYFCFTECCLFSFEIGYEFLSYHNCLDKVRSFDIFDFGDDVSTLGISIDDYSDFGLHGPYLAVRFVY